MFGLACACEIEIVLAKCGHRSETPVVPLPIEKIRIGNRCAFEAHSLRVQGHQLVRSRKGKRAQEDTVRHREKRGIRANSQRQCQHCNDREAAIFREHPNSVFQIWQQLFHPSTSRTALSKAPQYILRATFSRLCSHAPQLTRSAAQPSDPHSPLCATAATRPAAPRPPATPPRLGTRLDRLPSRQTAAIPQPCRFRTRRSAPRTSPRPASR